MLVKLTEVQSSQYNTPGEEPQVHSSTAKKFLVLGVYIYPCPETPSIKKRTAKATNLSIVTKRLSKTEAVE